MRARAATTPEQADAIPMGALPATTVPWAIAGAGVLSLPGKADAADTMNTNLKPVYTPELVSAAQQSLAGMQAMGTGIQTRLLPGLAQMLQLPPDQVQAYLAANFPAVAAGWRRCRPRGHLHAPGRERLSH